MDWKHNPGGARETWIIIKDYTIEAAVEKYVNHERFTVYHAQNKRNMGHYASLESAKAAAVSAEPVNTMIARLSYEDGYPQQFINEIYAR